MPKDSLTLKTEDDISIAADFYAGAGDRYAILLHMMPATKESWQSIAEKLQELGISSIAIDLRGHGESHDGPDGYKEFTDQEQAAKNLDVKAAMLELENRGATPQKTVVIGASIGANLAIRYLTEHPSISAAVALSPGLDYRSVTTDDVVQNLSENQKLLLVASEEDMTSILSVRKLHDLNPNQTELIEKQNIGHGTAMTDADSELFNTVVNWINEKI